jgi:hypothetical protein
MPGMTWYKLICAQGKTAAHPTAWNQTDRAAFALELPKRSTRRFICENSIVNVPIGLLFSIEEADRLEHKPGIPTITSKPDISLAIFASNYFGVVRLLVDLDSGISFLRDTP